ncbi:formyltetrahydrofolate deformylase [Kineococcus sp. SYSU DK006]|uniref:formyltetrahydrofolate deformylase n=1 Tax=Kineococcus sp. SYSU DK006 TaxID=3383127 RepID=UPI003D7DF666
MSTRPRVLTLSCPDRPGIVHAVTGALVALDANITESQQFGDPDTGLFTMRVAFDAAAPEEALRATLQVVAARFELTWKLSAADVPMRTLVMCSKQGHCLNDLLFRHRSGDLPIDVAAVVSNHTDLAPLAEFYGVPFHHVPVTTGDEASKAAGEARLLELVDELDVELVVLARYMQILSDPLCRSLTGRAINIHHSFLPSFKGARPYHQAHARGVKIIGATAHYVTADLDEGPIIEQEIERVDHRHTPAELVRLGQDVEARTLARAVRWHAEQRVLLDGNRTVVFR